VPLLSIRLWPTFTCAAVQRGLVTLHRACQTPTRPFRYFPFAFFHRQHREVRIAPRPRHRTSVIPRPVPFRFILGSFSGSPPQTGEISASPALPPSLTPPVFWDRQISFHRDCHKAGKTRLMSSFFLWLLHLHSSCDLTIASLISLLSRRARISPTQFIPIFPRIVFTWVFHSFPYLWEPVAIFRAQTWCPAPLRGASCRAASGGFFLFSLRSPAVSAFATRRYPDGWPLRSRFGTSGSVGWAGK